jgi:Acetyltransferase (GNAT) domain
MRAVEIPARWHEGLSVFACPKFLSAVGDQHGWLGGLDDNDDLRCILPYTVVRRGPLRMVRFRVETLPQGQDLSLAEEKAFLHSVVDFCRTIGADMVIPATTNTVFRTYPDGADAAPYGSYTVDLTRPEPALWGKIHTTYRQNINTARSAGVVVSDGADALDSVHAMVKNTFKRSDLPFMSLPDLERYVGGLGDNAKVLLATVGGRLESCGVFAVSKFSAYAVYVGTADQPVQGSNKLLYWEAMRQFKQAQVQCLDFVGTRIQPAKGSKHDGLSSFKRRLGATLKQGYMWKYPLSPLKYRIYCAAARLRSGGDIVDAERHKLGLVAQPGS